MPFEQLHFAQVSKYPPGTKLVVAVGEFTVSLLDFVSLLTGMSEYEAWWDLVPKDETDHGNDPGQ